MLSFGPQTECTKYSEMIWRRASWNSSGAFHATGTPGGGGETRRQHCIVDTVVSMFISIIHLHRNFVLETDFKLTFVHILTFATNVIKKNRIVSRKCLRATRNTDRNIRRTAIKRY